MVNLDDKNKNVDGNDLSNDSFDDESVVFESDENSTVNYYIKITKLCLKALCGSYSWLVVVKSIRKMQSLECFK